jgi:hypothetical protein
MIYSCSSCSHQLPVPVAGEEAQHSVDTRMHALTRSRLYPKNTEELFKEHRTNRPFLNSIAQYIETNYRETRGMQCHDPAISTPPNESRHPTTQRLGHHLHLAYDSAERKEDRCMKP